MLMAFLCRGMPLITAPITAAEANEISRSSQAETCKRLVVSICCQKPRYISK